ncbi:dihydroorotate dehydrogenase-like protein [Enemella sp. A6]|uniref:dihydroorotate dehydrogenase-like protein n=1 Tax=Enemella sp. A6 TaxID=3440152 RepID=UPI003EC11EA3
MDLTTNYLGLELAHPIIASAGPLSQTVDGVRALADGGAAAVVMYSLFEEQVRHEEFHDAMLTEEPAESYGEALSYFPQVPTSNISPTKTYLSLVEKAAEAVSVPVIGSINGSTMGGWTGVARDLQNAGAAAVELNIYQVPGEISTDARWVEDTHREILAAVKDAVTIPVAVKLSPYFSSFGAFALTLSQADADGLVLFNRFLQPEVDVERLTVEPGIGLSHSSDGRLPRTWIAALHGKLGTTSLCASGGVETWEDVARYILAGADVVGTTSALVRHGAGHTRMLLDGFRDWLERRQFTSLDQARGMLAVPADADASAYERAGYVAALEQAKQTYGPLARETWL